MNTAYGNESGNNQEQVFGMENWFEEQNDTEPGFDYRSLLKEIWRRKWLFVIPFVICLSMAALAIKTMTPIYYSSAQLEVRTSVYRSQLLNDPTGNIRNRRNLDNEIRWEMQSLLTSPNFLEGIVVELGMDKTMMAQSRTGDGPPLDEKSAIEQATRMLMKRLRLEQDGLHMYRIGVIDTDPHKAFDLTRFIVDRFLEEYRKARMAPRASTQSFLEEQRDLYRADLTAAEQELNDFLTEISSTDLISNPVSSLTLGYVEDRLTRVRERLAGPDAAEMAELQQAALPVLGALPATSTYAKDPIISAIRLELLDLGVQTMTLMDGETDQDAEREMGRMRVQINSRIEELVTLNHPHLGIMDRNRLSQYVYFALYSSIEREVADRVARHVRSYRTFLSQQPLQSTRLAELQNRVDHTNELVLTIEREITQQRMNLEAGMSDVGLQVSIRQQAAFDPIPIEPNKIRLAFMGFALSAAMGGGLVLLAMFMDKSLKNVADIEKTLGYPVLGALPHVQVTTLEKQRHFRVLFWISIILGILAVGAFGFLVIYPRLSM